MPSVFGFGLLWHVLANLKNCPQGRATLLYCRNRWNWIHLWHICARKLATGLTMSSGGLLFWVLRRWTDLGGTEETREAGCSVFSDFLHVRIIKQTQTVDPDFFNWTWAWIVKLKQSHACQILSTCKVSQHHCELVEDVCRLDRWKTSRLSAWFSTRLMAGCPCLWQWKFGLCTEAKNLTPMDQVGCFLIWMEECDKMWMYFQHNYSDYPVAVFAVPVAPTFPLTELGEMPWPWPLFPDKSMPRPTGTVTREEFRRHMRNDTMVPFGCSMLQLENDDFIAIHSALRVVVHIHLWIIAGLKRHGRRLSVGIIRTWTIFCPESCPRSYMASVGLELHDVEQLS